MQRIVSAERNVDSNAANPAEPRFILSHLFHLSLHIFYLFFTSYSIRLYFRKALDLNYLLISHYSLIINGNIILLNIIIKYLFVSWQKKKHLTQTTKLQQSQLVTWLLLTIFWYITFTYIYWIFLYKVIFFLLIKSIISTFILVSHYISSFTIK